MVGSLVLICLKSLQNFHAIRQEKCSLRMKYSDFQNGLSDPCPNIAECEERVYSVRGATPAVRGRGVLCEEKVCSISNVTSAVRGKNV